MKLYLIALLSLIMIGVGTYYIVDWILPYDINPGSFMVVFLLFLTIGGLGSKK